MFLKKRRPKVAFVLAGGGNRGAAQVGMLKALTQRGIIADLVVAVSVGAINGAAYAANPTTKGVDILADIWNSLRGEDIFPGGFLHGRWQFLQHKEAAYPPDGLRNLIERSLGYENLEQAKIPLEVVATSMADGGERWFSSGPVIDTIMASATLPGVFPPVWLNGEPLIDGGVVNDVPISRAIELGAKQIFVFLCGPFDYVPQEHKRPIETLLVAFSIAVQSRFRREMANLPKDVKVVVLDISPGPTLNYSDFSRTEQFMRDGFERTIAVLDKN